MKSIILSLFLSLTLNMSLSSNDTLYNDTDTTKFWLNYDVSPIIRVAHPSINILALYSEIGIFMGYHEAENFYFDPQLLHKFDSNPDRDIIKITFLKYVPHDHVIIEIKIERFINNKWQWLKTIEEKIIIKRIDIPDAYLINLNDSGPSQSSSDEDHLAKSKKNLKILINKLKIKDYIFKQEAGLINQKIIKILKKVKLKPLKSRI